MLVAITNIIQKYSIKDNQEKTPRNFFHKKTEILKKHSKTPFEKCPCLDGGRTHVNDE